MHLCLCIFEFLSLILLFSLLLYAGCLHSLSFLHLCSPLLKCQLSSVISNVASVCDTSLFIDNLYIQHYVRDTAGNVQLKNIIMPFSILTVIVLQDSLIFFQTSISIILFLFNNVFLLYTYELQLYIYSYFILYACTQKLKMHKLLLTSIHFVICGPVHTCSIADAVYVF